MTDEKKASLGHYTVVAEKDAKSGEYTECWCGAKDNAAHNDPGPQAGEHPGDKGVTGEGAKSKKEIASDAAAAKKDAKN